MGAYNYLDQAILGLMTGIEGMADFVEPVECMEAGGISYGSPVFAYVGNLQQGWNAHQDTAVITASGSFTVSDTAIIVTLNGVALATVGYGTSSAATGAAVNAVILAAIASISGATSTFNDSAHTFTIFTPGFDLTATLASSGGVTATTAYSSQAMFIGCAGFTQQSLVATAGGYQFQQSMNSAYFGFCYVPAAVAVQDGQAAYVIITPGTTQGQFTNTAGTNNLPTKAIFRTTLTGAGIANLELRGKQNAAGTL